MVIVDIWSGEFSQDHVARFFEPMSEALVRARLELNLGNLVNLRVETAWEIVGTFDYREPEMAS